MESDNSGFFEGFSTGNRKPQLFHTKAAAQPSGPVTATVTIPAAATSKKSSKSSSNETDAAAAAEVKKSVEQMQGEVAWFDLDLCKPLIKAVCEAGYVAPTPIQVKAIPAVMQGYDVCGRAVTGSGKTAAFLLPVLHKLVTTTVGSARANIRCLIITPTRELAVQCQETCDMLSQFCRHKLVSCVAVGGIPVEAQAQQLRHAPDLVVGTPGRLIDILHNTQGVSLDGVETLVFDEADKLLSEGYEEMIMEILNHVPKKRQTLLFSATMTRDVDKLAKLTLQRPLDIDIGHVAVAAQLQQEFIRVPDEEKKLKLAMLHVLCTKLYPSKTVVFAKYLTTVRRLKVVLELLNVPVVALHGILSMEQRMESIEKFGTGQAHIMVATELAARGLDIPGVETVINYDMPNTLTSYIHRVGRTARIGHSGRAVSLVGPIDEDVLSKIVKLTDSNIGGIVTSVKRREIDKADVQASQVRVDEIFPEVREALRIEELERDIDSTKNKVMRSGGGGGGGGGGIGPLGDVKGSGAAGDSWFESSAQKRARNEGSRKAYHNARNEVVKNDDDDDIANAKEPPVFERYTAADVLGDKKKKNKKTKSEQMLAKKEAKIDEKKQKFFEDQSGLLGGRKIPKKVKSPIELKGFLPKGKFKRVRKTEERRARKVAIKTGQAKARPKQSKRTANRVVRSTFKSKSRYRRR